MNQVADLLEKVNTFQSRIQFLEEELYVVSEEKYALMEACRIMNSTLETKSLLDLILYLSQEVMKAEASSLLLINDEEQHMYFHVMHGDKASQLKDVRVPLGGKSIAGWVASNNKPLLIADAQHDKRWFKGADKQTAFVTKTMIAVPLLSQGKPIGVVEVLNKKSGNFFDHEDLKLLVALTDQAGNALEKSELYENISQEKQKIETIITSMSDGIVVFDKDFNIILYNRSADEVFQLKEYERQGSIPEKFEIIIEELKDFEENTVFDVCLLKPENIILSGKITNLYNDNEERTGVIIAFRNITESKKNERIRAEFLAFVSHQLIEPLQEVERIVNLNNSEENNVAQFEYLKDRIHQLMFFSELEAGPLRLDRLGFDVIAMTEMLLDELSKRYCENNVNYKLVSKFTDCEIVADEERVQHSFYAIIKNCFLRSEKDGKIFITIEDCGDEKISVYFTGKGKPFEADFIDKIMKKDFLTAITNLKGEAGDAISENDQELNLIFAKHTIDAHGGKLELLNDKGCFGIKIELYKEI
ncbi:GAF domain-containing protein [bacterium]|nr:GAF domain-containing protein [bacterium]